MTVVNQAVFAPGWYVATPTQVQSIGLVPGVRHDDRRAVWLVHRTHLPLLGLQAAPFNLPDPPAVLFGDGITQMRPHQKIAAEFIRQRRGTLLADGMRVGKSAAIVGSHDPELGRLVVAGPLQTRRVWINWMQRRWPDEEPVVLTGREYDPDRLDNAKLIFIHYNVLKAWVSLGIRKRIGTLVLDEAHLLANHRSQQSVAASEMSPVAERVICATGTPLWNAPDSIYGVLRVACPAAFGTWFDFVKRYASGRPGANGWEVGEPSETVELQARLSEMMIRRVWADIAADVPETIRSVHSVDVTASQRRDLDLIAADLSSETDLMTVVGELARYRKLVAVAKAPEAAEVALRKTQNGPVVVWVWHRKTSEAIKNLVQKKVPCWIVDGSISDAERREALLDEWRATNNGVLIMSIAVGQAGIDLSHARQAVFAEIDWTPAVLGQSEMRTFDLTRSSEVIYLVARHDVEEKIVEVLAKKCDQAQKMGVPAADTAIDILGQALGRTDICPDLDDLAARIARQVSAVGNTIE